MAPSIVKKSVSKPTKRPINLVEENGEDKENKIHTNFKKIRQSNSHDEIAKDDEMELCEAAKRGNISEVERLLSNGMLDINSQKTQTTPLVEAAYHGHLEVVKLLLDRGAEPNKKKSCGSTPLLFAASLNHTELVKLLLERGALPNRTNGRNETPLHYAGWHGNRDVAQLLLDRGALPDLSTISGKTPLHWAEIWKNLGQKQDRDTAQDVIQLIKAAVKGGPRHNCYEDTESGVPILYLT